MRVPRWAAVIGVPCSVRWVSAMRRAASSRAAGRAGPEAGRGVLATVMGGVAAGAGVGAGCGSSAGESTTTSPPWTRRAGPGTAARPGARRRTGPWGDDGGAVGEDADHVGAAADLLVQPFLRVVRPDLPPDLPREGGEGQQVVLGGVQVGCGLGEFGLQRVQDVPHLCLDRVGVGLFEDRPQQRGHPGLGRLRDLAQQVPRVVGAAALPRGAGQHRTDRVDEAGVGVGDDELDAGQATGDQGTQEGQPAGAVLGGGDVQAEDLAVAVGVDADRDQRVHVDDAAALADLLGERVDPDERVRAGVQGPVAKGGDLLVQVLGHRADLGLRQLRHPEGLGELLHSAGGDTEQVGGGDHRDQGLFGPAAALEQPVREVAALPQLGNGELDGPSAGVPLARAVAVAVVDAFVADLPVLGVAERVGLRRHERVGERLDHRAQQIGTRRGKVLLGEGVQGQTVRCGHRADLLRASTTRRSAGGRSHIRALTPTPGQTAGSGGNPYTTSQGATQGK